MSTWATTDLGLSGWVRNLPDGRVAVEGSKDVVDKMVHWCHQNPSAVIKDVAVEYEKPEGIRGLTFGGNVLD